MVRVTGEVLGQVQRSQGVTRFAVSFAPLVPGSVIVHFNSSDPEAGGLNALCGEQYDDGVGFRHHQCFKMFDYAGGVFELDNCFMPDCTVAIDYTVIRRAYGDHTSPRDHRHIAVY